MISMDTDGVRIAVVVAGALLAAAYIFWGPVSIGRKKCPVSGLVNLGNSCFLNAILQAIAPCIAAATWLKNVSRTTHETHFGAILYTTINAINYPDRPEQTVLSAAAVLEALARRCWVIGAGQQDAHEMYLCLTSTLEEELYTDNKATSSIPVHVLTEEDCKTKVGINRISSSILRFDKKLDQRMPFRGLLASQLRCQTCGYKRPIKMETFDSLSVTIPPSHLGHLSLLGCLQHFMTAEKVHDVDCKGCTSLQKTSSKSTFIKRLTIAKFPETLCIHIARTAWVDDTGMPVKRHDHISFSEYMNTLEFVNGVKSVSTMPAMTGGSKPNFWSWGADRHFNINFDRNTVDSFLMAGHLKKTLPSVSSLLPVDKSSRSTATNLYQLKSVVEHFGDAYGGHFVTYRRGAPNTRHQNQWYSCSDTEIQEISFKKVLQCTAYLLFYERQPPIRQQSS